MKLYKGSVLLIPPCSISKIFPVFLEQGVGILFAGLFGGGYVVLVGFQPLNNLFGGFVIGPSPLGVKFGQRLVQTENSGL